MKGLRVKTGVRAPALIEIPVPDHPFPSPLVPLPRCTNVTKAGAPCGVCHYCKVATLGPEYWAR